MNNASFDPEKLTTYELWYGRNGPPPLRTCLRAGPLEAIWEAGDLRGVRLQGLEILRRAYMSVRDENWDTIPACMTNLSVNAESDCFRISFDASNSSRALELQWHATFTGEPDGTITLAMEGQATLDFSYCCIGFCLLHPLTEYCGQPFTGNGPAGPVSGHLPTLIAPQRYEGGFYLPLFPSVSSLGVSLKSGIEAKFEFEGDLFEMEDQRNWTDGSFKTYCTPLSLGYPFQAHAGQSFKQKVTLRVKVGRVKNTQGVPMFNSRSALRCGARCRKLGSALPHMVRISPSRTRICSRGYASIICVLSCISRKAAQSKSWLAPSASAAY